MPVPYRIHLTKQADGTEDVCSGLISDVDWLLFSTYRDYAEELKATEWVRSGLDAEYSVTSDDKWNTCVEVRNKPSDAVVSQLLHRMRPFVLQNEPTWYPTVNSRMRGYLDHSYLRQWLAAGRRIFDHGHFSLYGQISINDLPLHDERTFNLWLNAFEYHRDQGKRAKLTEALNGPPDDLALAVFRAMLADKAAEVMRIAHLITDIETAPSNRNR
jgi:hypothetical protein